MSGYLMHSDPSVYEEPFEFIPERWLGDINPNMIRNFVPFSRGWSARVPSLPTVLTCYRLAELFGPEFGAGGDQPCACRAISPWRREAGVV